MKRSLVVVVLAFSSGLVGCGRGDDAAKSAAAQSGAVADADAGQMVYCRGCVSCHGPTAEGLVHQGPSLRNNEFIASHHDEELVAFLLKGRPVKDATNRSKLPMPAGGTLTGFGEDAQSDRETMADVVAFLRRVQRESAAAEARHHATTTNTIWPSVATDKVGLR
jgi:mono/diheme cytochrome c family protein